MTQTLSSALPCDTCLAGAAPKNLKVFGPDFWKEHFKIDVAEQSLPVTVLIHEEGGTCIEGELRDYLKSAKDLFVFLAQNNLGGLSLTVRHWAQISSRYGIDIQVEKSLLDVPAVSEDVCEPVWHAVSAEGYPHCARLIDVVTCEMLQQIGFGSSERPDLRVVTSDTDFLKTNLAVLSSPNRIRVTHVTEIMRPGF